MRKHKNKMTREEEKQEIKKAREQQKLQYNAAK